MSRFSRRILVPVLVALGAPAVARSQSPSDSTWAAVRRVFGQAGEVEDGYFRVNLPRSDLAVRIGNDVLAPRFEFTSYVGFAPMGARTVLAMGEVVLRESEVPGALAEAHRQVVRVTAVHNHLLGETPRIVYMHIMAEGPADAVAARVRAIFARTATPLAREREKPSQVDWAAIDSVLGAHSEAEESIAEYEFPRREPLAVRGRALTSSGALETASEAVFQRLDAGRVASTGELFVLPAEVDPVLRALDAHGLHVTAVHNHMLDATPTMYWIHWYATGNGPTLARGVAAALAEMNSARRTQPVRTSP